MTIQRYSVNQHPIQTLLTWIESDEIAIPEIQRPFVWNAAKVRDFIDSLYFGYPVGYLIAWRNPSVRLKDGSESAGKRILIDGQQRVTALLAAMLGRQVVNKSYRMVRITIAFHPGEERFEVTNPAIRRDRAWLADIANLFAPDTKLLRVVDAYCESNPESSRDEIYERIERLRGIRHNLLGLIELNADLDVETVSEIFVRINSQGVPLNAADFAMSKMAANEKYNGHQLRKCIDYFCHLAVAPEAYANLASDSEFTGTRYFQAMQWLKHEKEDLYDPSYTDMLRVAFTSEFGRGRLDDLVALLSGRNFETREFEEAIAEDSFGRLDAAILRFMNETDFKRFVMILRSAGFRERIDDPVPEHSKLRLYRLSHTTREARQPSAHRDTGASLVCHVRSDRPLYGFARDRIRGRYTQHHGTERRGLLGHGGAGGALGCVLGRWSAAADGHFGGEQPLLQRFPGESSQGKRQGVLVERPYRSDSAGRRLPCSPCLSAELLEEARFGARPLQSDRELRGDAGRNQYCNWRRTASFLFQRPVAPMR